MSALAPGFAVSVCGGVTDEREQSVSGEPDVVIVVVVPPHTQASRLGEAVAHADGPVDLYARDDAGLGGGGHGDGQGARFVVERDEDGDAVGQAAGLAAKRCGERQAFLACLALERDPSGKVIVER